MTLKQLMDMNNQNSMFFLILFAAIPILALILNIISSPDSAKTPWKYVYSVLVYITSIPGMFCTVILLYTMLFIRQNILMLNITTYFLPIVSMIVTLALIRKNLTFDEIPGFKKLSGLMLVMGLTFASLILIERTRIFVITSLQMFLILCVIIFFLLKYGIKMIFGDFKKKETSGK